MSRRVLFNGAVLVRPGAATRIDASQFQNITLSGLGIVGLIGEADGGESRTVHVFSSPASVKQFYKSGDLVEAAGIVADPSADSRLTAGAQTIVCYKVNNSAAATLAHDGKVTFTSRQYGILTNNITVAVAAAAGSERVATITDIDSFGVLVSEVSPSLGTVGKFTIRYTGADAAAAMTINATSLVVTATTVAESFTALFSDFKTLADLVAHIDGKVSYTCSSLVSNATSFNPANLDAVAAVDIKGGLVTGYARNWDLVDWITNNSSIVTATLTQGQLSPMAVLAATPLAGGTRGTSDNTAWTSALVAMGGLRINQLVPLVSKDAVATQGSFTLASITAALVAHAKFYSSTVGRSERQAWLGVEGTKTALIAAANLANSEHLCLVGQKTKRLRTSDNSIVFFPEWATACTLAGLRSGASLGEPLTWKYINSLGISSDASWKESNNDDVVDLALNGVIVVNEVRGAGFRIDKAVTTFTKMDNDAFTEETIVQTWKGVAYELRRVLEDVYTGRPGSVKTIQAVPGTVISVLELFRQAGAITDSLIDGKAIKAYRSITVGLMGDQLSVAVTISPTPGINFILNTLVLVPAQISL